ncbi:MAG: DUF1648 domain-containing protein [Planctomycetota bacterium]
MNTLPLRIGLLVVLYVCFGVSLFASAAWLPDRVATHFDMAGVANGWMSRSTHLMFMSVFGLVFPNFLICICWSIRFLPAGLVNIPHREYWLADERRSETASYLVRHSVWFACLALGFVIGLHGLVVLSNQRQPPQLPVVWVLGVAGPFLVGVAAWVICLYRRFRIAGPDGGTMPPARG